MLLSSHLKRKCETTSSTSPKTIAAGSKQFENLWCFQTVFILTPNLWWNDPIWLTSFQRGWFNQPPSSTNWCFVCRCLSFPRWMLSPRDFFFGWLLRKIIGYHPPNATPHQEIRSFLIRPYDAGKKCPTQGLGFFEVVTFHPLDFHENNSGLWWIFRTCFDGFAS